MRQYEPIISKYEPEMIDEMRGVAEEAEVEYEDILYINTFSEVVEGCSIWAACGEATENGQVLLGMNTDEMNRTRKTQIMLSAKPQNKIGFIGTTYAGLIAPFQGMNRSSLAISTMLLNVEHVKTQTQIGSPIFILSEIILSQCLNVQEALGKFEEP
ncbi:MAG: C45 family autoproteolytic acyltransferase/hydrolase [Promethearchaeota archaeon]